MQNRIVRFVLPFASKNRRRKFQMSLDRAAEAAVAVAEPVAVEGAVAAAVLVAVAAADLVAVALIQCRGQ
jgi:hypothetical protein